MRKGRYSCWVTPFLCLALVAALAGCRSSGRPFILVDAASGRQSVWPYFLEGHPTVLAFWSTEKIQCIRDIPGLNTLNRRHAIQLVSVATGPDRAEIDQCIRGRYRDAIQYEVLVDQEQRLAKKLHVKNYPTYILFNTNGSEISRAGDIRKIGKWFNDPKWLKKSGALIE